MRIEVRGLTKRFGETCALDGVGFTVPEGRRAAVVGPNGSGKSTLNRALLGLLRYEGEISLDGLAPGRDGVAVAARTAYVPQTPPRIAATVAEVVRTVRDVRPLPAERVEHIASVLGLDIRAVADRSLAALSGGMRQKLLVALALAVEAELLVLDEPTASLDGQTRERFFELCGALPARTTLLLCSHRLEEVRPLVDHVLALEEGRIAYDGPADAFLDAWATSVIEVCAAGEAGARLAAHGFRRASGAWWVRSVRRGEKAAVLGALVKELGSDLRDLNVRELPSLELHADASHAGGPRHG